MIKDNGDISRKVVVIMLIVAIITSLLGTWTVISTINSMTVVKNNDNAALTGFIGVTVASDPNGPYNKKNIAEKEGSQ